MKNNVMYNSDALKKAYDKKAVNVNDINNLLGKDDNLIFNHNGILMPGDNVEQPDSEIKLLEYLHKLEINQVKYLIGKMYDLEKDGLLLDAGCGSGGSSILIHNAKKCKIEGYTLSPEQAKVGNRTAKKYGIEGFVKFEVGNILSFEEKCYNKFDYIYASENTEHLTDLRLMFSEFGKVAKSAGVLIIVAWCATKGERGMIIKKQVDEHYLTDIHTIEEYINIGCDSDWEIKEVDDMTELTAPYWEARLKSENVTGSEKFMYEGFNANRMQYCMFKFKKK